MRIGKNRTDHYRIKGIVDAVIEFQRMLTYDGGQRRVRAILSTLETSDVIGEQDYHTIFKEYNDLNIPLALKKLQEAQHLVQPSYGETLPAHVKPEIRLKLQSALDNLQPITRAMLQLKLKLANVPDDWSAGWGTEPHAEKEMEEMIPILLKPDFAGDKEAEAEYEEYSDRIKTPKGHLDMLLEMALKVISPQTRRLGWMIEGIDAPERKA